MREKIDMIYCALLVMGTLGCFFGDLADAQQIPKTSFSCAGRVGGYYADVSTGCQVYHMCDGLGRQFSYSCPNATLFQQRMLICDHWYMVNCSRATDDYKANLLIGQRNKPFVEDSETNPYSRTPRPDLLVAPTNLTEYNIVYRTGQQNLSPRDYVGVESEDENSTDQPTYFPPSNWSTEISKQQTTFEPTLEQRRRSDDLRNSFQRRGPQVVQNAFNNNVPHTQEKNFDHQGSHVDDGGRQPSKIRGKAINVFSSNRNRNDLGVNFKSNFKATTPVYPQFVEDTTRSPDNIGLLPPNSYNVENEDDIQEPILELLPPVEPATSQKVDNEQDNRNTFKVNFPSNYKATTPVYPSMAELPENVQETFAPIVEDNKVKVNFRSNFKATTPVYPTLVDATSVDPDQLGISPPKEVIVNYQSNFKATTPQYPTSVEPTSPKPESLGILPPKSNENFNFGQEDDEENKKVTINFASRFKATTPKYPTFVEQTSPNPSDAGLLPPKERESTDKNVAVNFDSNFKATTPNYPFFVDPTSPDPNEVGLQPPKQNKNSEIIQVNFESNFKASTPQYPTYVDPTSPNPNDVGLLPPKTKVAYKSKFKATTPKYPSFVESTSPDPSEVGLVAPRETVVNFHSDFKATTPQYPNRVDATSPDPGEAGLLAPQPPNLVGLLGSNKNYRDNTKDVDTNWDYPAKFYQPPSLDADAVGEEELQEIPGIRLLNFMKSFNKEQWQELRQTFKIPEYDFPLDDATRPGYDSIVNSFEPVAPRK